METRENQGQSNEFDGLDLPILVYVAGPYSAPDSFRRELNVRRAEVIALCLALAGFSPVCPHTQARHWFEAIPEPEVITLELSQLAACRAMVAGPGWMWSGGTQREIRFSKSRGIPVVPWEVGGLGPIWRLREMFGLGPLERSKEEQIQELLRAYSWRGVA